MTLKVGGYGKDGCTCAMQAGGCPVHDKKKSMNPEASAKQVIAYFKSQGHSICGKLVKNDTAVCVRNKDHKGGCDLMTIDDKVEELEKQIFVLKKTLYTLIAWMPQSSVSPITRDEAKILLEDLSRM